MHWLRSMEGAGNLAEFLYGNKADAKALDNQLRYYAGSIPVLGDIAKFYDSNAKMTDYMSNRGISWRDMQYPSINSPNRVNPVASARAFDNDISAIERLYDEPYNNRMREYMRGKQEEMYDTSIRANRMREAWYYSRMRSPPSPQLKIKHITGGLECYAPATSPPGLKFVCSKFGDAAAFKRLLDRSGVIA